MAGIELVSAKLTFKQIKLKSTKRLRLSAAVLLFVQLLNPPDASHLLYKKTL
jgi:hypothetical protein